jgi:hypothetical protein
MPAWSATAGVRARQRLAILAIVPADRTYIQKNDRERERLRALAQRLSPDELRTKVNEFWTVAGVLGHLAFWDARAQVLAERVARGEPFTPSDDEPPDPAWINDSTRALIHAISPRAAAELAVQQAEDTDARVASLSDEQLGRTWPADETSPLNTVRATHRAEHLDEIEAALGRR